MKKGACHLTARRWHQRNSPPSSMYVVRRHHKCIHVIVIILSDSQVAISLEGGSLSWLFLSTIIKYHSSTLCIHVQMHVSWQVSDMSDMREKGAVLLSAFNSCALPAALGAESQSDNLTQSLPQNSQSWLQQLRTGQLSFLRCCVLLRKPHMEPHVTANSNSHKLLSAGPLTAQELPLQGPQQNSSSQLRREQQQEQEHTCTHASVGPSGSRHVKRKRVFAAFLRGTRLLCPQCSTQATVWVCKKGHRSSLANVDKRFIVEGGMSNPITQLLGCYSPHCSHAATDKITAENSSCVTYFALGAAAWLAFCHNAVQAIRHRRCFRGMQWASLFYIVNFSG